MKKQHQKASRNHEKTFKKSMQKRAWKKYGQMMPKSLKIVPRSLPKSTKNQKQCDQKIN